MSERRNLWYLLAVVALLLAPFAITIQPALAAGAYIVTSTADTGGTCISACTLRQAITSANTDLINSTISFNFAGSGNITIAPSAELPSLSEPGTTISGQINTTSFLPRIIIDGGGTRFYGLSISASASNTVVENLIFTGFQGTRLFPPVAAIYVDRANAVTIKGSYIGNVPGVAYAASQANKLGVFVLGGSATIGGPRLTDRNTISGNTGDGVIFSSATGGSVLNSYIGVVPSVSQVSPLANSGNGVQVESSTGVTVGGTPPNIISANTLNGILVTGSTAISNTISYNSIGTDENGSTHGGLSFGNGQDGVLVSGGAKSTVLTGAGLASPTLLISNNTGYGLRVTTGASGTQIGGAIIGLDATGLAGLANTLGGVALLDNSTGTAVGPGNYISGNAGPGITLKLSSVAYTSISASSITGNFIGLNTSLTGTVANSGPGIDVQDASSNTLIGSAASPNYLAGNGGAAISIMGTQTFSTTVSNNTIGLLNDGGGIYNVAATNVSDGVLISGGPQRTTVTANTIGSHPGSGVNVVGSSTVTVTLNKIGWAITSATDGTPLARANATGITVNAAQAVDVRSNIMRLNTGDGVLVAGASSNVQVLSNTITMNLGQGVHVQDTSQRVRIQYNRMTGNAGGVLLQGTSRYVGNNGADPDTSTLPNHGIDPPIYDLANANPLRLRLDQNGVVSGWVYTDTNRVSSCVPVASCHVQFFRSFEGSPDNQGFSPLSITPEGGAFAVDFATPNAAGFFSGQLSDILPLPGQLLFAATDGDGNTSEFGVLHVAPILHVGYLSPVDGQQNAMPGQTITYTLSLTNSGTIDFTNLKFTTGRTLPHWVVSPLNQSVNLLNLPVNSTKTVAVSLKLPSGADAYVQAGMKDTTLVTVTVADLRNDLLINSRVLTTTVLATPVITVSTVKGAGTAPPLGQVTHTYRYTNSGNVLVTLNMIWSTVDPASNNSSIWATTLSQNNSAISQGGSISIAPGSSADVDARVTVPLGAQVTDPKGVPIRVTTYLTATAQAPYASIVREVSDTTGVDLVPSVQMGGNGQSTSAESNAEITFYHSVINTSNGPARFCLNSRANSGSQVLSFLSQSSSIEISQTTQGSCFTLDTGSKSVLSFMAKIKVTGKLLPGETDSISMYLVSGDTGKELANGAVSDTVIITSSPLLPRIWLPMINV
ncbi:MAG: right-handed parallel beta-helix repeat-containing protein [Chloroflexales bacterium]